LNTTYIEYAEALRDATELEESLNAKKLTLKNLRQQLEACKVLGDGSIGLDVSAHAHANISERLQRLSMENTSIYGDVFNLESPQSSIIWPSNLKVFIITLIAQAYDKDMVVQKPSKNKKDGLEYHYSIKITKWSSDEQSLIFTAVVEDYVIKTGYFNWSN
jgi:hypothetical protein